MSRLYKSVVYLVWIGVAFLATLPLQAQSEEVPPSSASTEQAASTASPAAGFAATLVTATVTPPVSSQLLPTPTPIAQAATDEPMPPDDAPLQGTIITNRGNEPARFFLEGATYLLPAGIARGFALPRQTSVLNLYNCSAEIAESATCFWDPYLVESNGLYDIYSAPAGDNTTKLLLQEAGSPPDDQVWIQNRTGQLESLVFEGAIHELPATGLVEFPVALGAPAILYVRHCLTMDQQSVCEWTPKSLEAGAYYALVDNTISGSTPGSTITTVELRPVVGGVVGTPEESTQPPSIAPVGTQFTCELLVPVLNVRSGPGLQYTIIDKIRSEGAEAASVAVTGRSEDGQWLTVDPSVTPDGWITSSANFISCTGSMSDLPLVEAPAPPDPAPAPVPQPAPVDSTNDQAPVDATDAAEAQATEEPTPDAPVVPAGQGLLVINNGFQHEMRVTIDQQYRPQQGTSEYDLQPGASTTVVVFPGNVAFTVSSPWNGLSRNAALDVEPDTSKTLWLRFEADSSGSWYLLWE